MKLIDLLNKIKNKENMPSEIIFDKGKFKWNTLEHFYERGDGSDLLELCTIYNTDDLLNMEVESIEDEIDIDSIEKLDDTCYIMYGMQDEEIETYHNKTRTTMNEILQAVKQIDKRVKKLERTSK